MGDRALTEVEKLLSLPDPLLSFKWVCLLLPFQDITRMRPEYVEAIDLPFNNVGVAQSVYTGGGFTMYPTSHTISTLSLTFYEDRFGTAGAYIQYWKSLIKNFATGEYGLPHSGKSTSSSKPGYKQDILVALLDQRNEKVVTARVKDVFPSDTQAMSLNYTDGSGRITIQQTFSVDDIEYSYPLALNP